MMRPSTLVLALLLLATAAQGELRSPDLIYTSYTIWSPLHHCALPFCSLTFFSFFTRFFQSYTAAPNVVFLQAVPTPANTTLTGNNQTVISGLSYGEKLVNVCVCVCVCACALVCMCEAVHDNLRSYETRENRVRH